MAVTTLTNEIKTKIIKQRESRRKIRDLLSVCVCVSVYIYKYIDVKKRENYTMYCGSV